MTVSDIRRGANDAARQTRSLVARQIENGAQQVGRRLTSTADDLRRAADAIRPDDGVPGMGILATRGADALGKIGNHLEHTDGQALLVEFESLMVRQPLATSGTALALGFAVSRIAKASRAARDARHAIDDRQLDAAAGALEATAPARGRIATFIAERPLVVAAGATIVGAIAGFVLPMVKAERKRVAPFSNDLLDRARTIVREAVSAGRDVARDAADAAATSAREHGATIAQHAVEGTPFEPFAPTRNDHPTI